MLVVVGVDELLDVPPVGLFDDASEEDAGGVGGGGVVGGGVVGGGVVGTGVVGAGEVGAGVVVTGVVGVGSGMFTLLVAPGVRVEGKARDGNCALQGVLNATRALKLNSDNGDLALRR